MSGKMRCVLPRPDTKNPIARRTFSTLHIEVGLYYIYIYIVSEQSGLIW